MTPEERAKEFREEMEKKFGFSRWNHFIDIADLTKLIQEAMDDERAKDGGYP